MSTDKISEYLAQFSQAPHADHRAAAPRHRRPDRGHRADPRRHLHARPLPARRRARAWPRRSWSARSARSSTSRFKRIQFTPDLMPSDITGTTVLDENEPAGASSASSRGRSSPTSSWPTRSTARRPRRRPPCCRRCRNARSPPARRRTTCPTRSSSSPRRTRSSRKAPIRCPKPSSTASCSTSRSIIPTLRRGETHPRPGHAATSRRRSPRCSAAKAILNMQKLVRSVPVGDYVKDYVTRLVRATRPQGPDGAGLRQARWSTGAPARAPASS